jgi:NADP-dependent 3-hydroxy acid dehydrogenase YdfG
VDERPLAGRVALVTGASAGVGASIARTLAAAGATAIGAARRKERLDAFGLELDVRDEASIAAAFAQLRATHGRLDILVNNAGMIGRGSMDDANTDSWRANIETNLLGAMLVTHAALPLIKASPAGHVVNILSTIVYAQNPGNGPYGAGKMGLRAFTESLRKELAPTGVRVTAIMPGYIASEFYSHTPDAMRRDWMRQITPLQPEDVAATVLYALAQPPHVSISELAIRPTQQIG